MFFGCFYPRPTILCIVVPPLQKLLSGKRCEWFKWTTLLFYVAHDKSSVWYKNDIDSIAFSLGYETIVLYYIHTLHICMLVQLLWTTYCLYICHFDEMDTWATGRRDGILTWMRDRHVHELSVVQIIVLVFQWGLKRGCEGGQKNGMGYKSEVGR